MLSLAPAHPFCAMRTMMAAAPAGGDVVCPVRPPCANAGTASRPTRTVTTIGRIIPPFFVWAVFLIVPERLVPDTPDRKRAFLLAPILTVDCLPSLREVV